MDTGLVLLACAAVTRSEWRLVLSRRTQPGGARRCRPEHHHLLAGSGIGQQLADLSGLAWRHMPARPGRFL